MNPLMKEELQVIDTFLDGANEEQLESSKQMFRVTDLNSLNWTFRKLSALKEQEAEIKKLAQQERERIDYWERKELSGTEQSIQFFEMLIQEYHAKTLEQDPKAKTLSTPYGKSKTRSSKAQPDKGDEEVLLQHIKANQMIDYIKETVKWGDLKKTLRVVELGENQVVVDENGQIVPGAIVKPASISFSVEVE